MSFSKLRMFMRSKHAKTIGLFTGVLGGTFAVLYTVQDIKYEKERLRHMSPEKAADILVDHGMTKEKEFLEKELKRAQKNVKDNYEFVPMKKPDREIVTKVIKSSMENASVEKRLTLALTKCASLQSETEKFMSLLQKRLSGRPSQAVQYKALKEFEKYFTDTLICAEEVLNEVKDILSSTSDEHFLKTGNEIKKENENIISLIQTNLNDIKKSLNSILKGSKNR